MPEWIWKINGESPEQTKEVARMERSGLNVLSRHTSLERLLSDVRKVLTIFPDVQIEISQAREHCAGTYVPGRASKCDRDWACYEPTNI